MGKFRYHACVVPDCTLSLRKQTDGLSLHRFPNAKYRSQQRIKWTKIIQSLNGMANWEPSEDTQICSRHFEAGLIYETGKRKVIANEAIPSKFLSKNHQSELSMEVDHPADNEEEVSITEKTDSTGFVMDEVEMTNSIAAIDECQPDPLASLRTEDGIRQFDVTCSQCNFVNSVVVSDFNTLAGSTTLSQHTRIAKPSLVSRKRLFTCSESPPSPNDLRQAASSSSIQVTPRSRKNVRREHCYSDSPNRAADELKDVKAELLEWKRKCKSLQEKLNRREKCALSLKEKLKEMKVLSKEQLESLENRFPGLLKTILKNETEALRVKGKTGLFYDDELRKFAATLHFYSPKAYSFLRDHLTLPHPHTITSWMKSSDCGPGFNNDVIKLLGDARRADSKNIMTDIVMMIDEMSIHKDLIWNAAKHCYVGHVNYGVKDAEPDTDTPLAANSLVCMIAGLSGGWKCPIGYIYTEKADSDIQRCFVDRAFFLLEEEGFIVHTLTCDGNSANVAMFESYGVVECPLNENGDVVVEKIQTSFPNPANADRLVNAVYDIVHMLKLWRNLLAQCGEIITEDGKVVNWMYVEAVQNIQEAEKIRAANRLGRLHIEFQNHKMNVRLAAQALSKSTADAIVFCREDLKLANFQESEATSNFIYQLDKVFDILNSRSPAQKGQKAPLNRSNLALQVFILEQFCNAVVKMKYTEVRNYKKSGKEVRVEKLLVQSLRKRAVIGMVVSIRSIITVSKSLLYRTQSPFKYIMTYRFSQDLIELFFNKIRGRLGKNNNPNVIEFEHVMKRIWHQNLLKSTNTGNCINQMEDRGIPGGLLPLKTAPKLLRLEDEEVEDLDLHGFTQPKNSGFYRNCLAYVAGNVVRVVGTKMKCELCAEGLLDQPTDEIDLDVKLLIRRKDRGGLFTPCQSVFKLVELSDAIFRQLVAESSGKMNIANLDRRVIKAVTEKCVGAVLFPHIQDHVIDFDPLETESHLVLIIKSIVSHFLRIRLFDYGKRYQKFKAISTRHKLNKLTLFKNQ